MCLPVDNVKHTRAQKRIDFLNSSSYLLISVYSCYFAKDFVVCCALMHCALVQTLYMLSCLEEIKVLFDVGTI